MENVLEPKANPDGCGCNRVEGYTLESTVRLELKANLKLNEHDVNSVQIRQLKVC